jgi:hypothetical protein
MGRFAKGKRSRAISDRSGFEVPYTQLKTTWNNLRVEPEEFEVKHPRLTPPKNIIDPTALFDPRPNNDPENVSIFFNFNWFNNAPTGMQATQYKKPNLPVGKGSVGFVSFEVENTSISGIQADFSIGSLILSSEIGGSGVAGTGALGAPLGYTEYTVSVANPGSGNRYYIDSVLQQQLYLQEGGTYRFDQSDSSNSGHPLRFSTTSNGSHGGGSEYTTGVTTNGTPGSSGAYTQIVVPEGVSTLYYYCTSHSAMGGTAFTPSSGTISLAITVVNPGSGNKYYIDSGGPAITISLQEGKTYRFDQSDSSNSGHPLRFSTTSNGSHGGGSEYTTGVTTSGTPGSAGAYTQITVAAGVATLYYYCTSHSAMGGQLNTLSSTDFDSVELSINEAGVAGTGGVGNINGNNTITESGVAGTGGVGSESIQILGWGNEAWGDGGYGE